jgi:hypothetical protein
MLLGNGLNLQKYEYNKTLRVVLAVLVTVVPAVMVIVVIKPANECLSVSESVKVTAIISVLYMLEPHSALILTLPCFCFIYFV